MACQFNRLSDCILLILLEQLDSTSLYQLSRVNSRFQQLALENSLWRKIDARQSPNDERKINYILDRVHSSTNILLLKGRRAYPRVVELIQSNTFSKLTILALENQIISQRNGVKLSDFPKSLVELSFKNSFFESSSQFFRKGSEAMENLKVLIIDGCSNVSCSVIMSVSKYPNLEIFSCYKCPIENSVAYFNIAVSNGFKKIKVFDVRLSGLGNTFLTAVMRKANIIILYFQNKDTSYELDFRNRAKEASILNLPVPKVRFRMLSVSGNEENLVTDFGTLEFSRTAANYEERKLPKSFLYTYPYPPCTCGFKERQEQRKLKLDEAESTQLITYKRGDERNLVEIINEEDYSDEDSSVDNEENGNVDGYSERGNNAGNSNTETGQSSGKRRKSKSLTSSACDVNSHLDAQDQNQSPTSRACTEIIYRVFSKKKTTMDQSVGTDHCPEAPEDGVVAVDSCSDQPNTGAAKSEDLPSTSGSSVPLRKRKLSDADNEGGKKARRSNSNDGSSSSGDEDGKREKEADAKANIPCPLSSSDRGDQEESDKPDNEHPEGKILYISRGGASSGRVSDAVSSFLNEDRAKRQAESADGDSNDPSTSRARRRDVALVECRAGRDAQPARTQVYPCACGNHSVIVVTADETEDGDGPPLNPPENHFHPQHCEQRINLNDHQSLRVINRNEIANARPQIELVDINKDKFNKSELKQVSFRGYHRVTDLTLRNVGHLHLDLLDVTYTGCTKKGLLDFLRINPNCRVLHKDFCVCEPRLDF